MLKSFVGPGVGFWSGLVGTISVFEIEAQGYAELDVFILDI